MDSFRIRAAAFVWLMILPTLAGCGGGPSVDVEMVTVTGVVAYDDGSFPTGDVRLIRFEPVKDSTRQGIRKAAYGEISAEDGTFSLSTVKPGDGAIVDKYKVLFTVLKTTEEGDQPLVAPQYTAADTTPYEIDLTEPISELKYELRRP